jgi:hypothetical protein
MLFKILSEDFEEQGRTDVKRPNLRSDQKALKA